MAEFRMPALGADMEAGTLTKWLVKPGDTVRKGDLVAVVDTQKADVEVEIFTGGVIDKILVREGEKVPVGTVLATLRAVGEAAVAAEAPAPSGAPPAARYRISPAARKRVEELGIEIRTLTGSGPEGAITLEDVEKAAGAPRAGAAAPPVSRAQAMRQAIAAAMSRSKREIPHYYLSAEIDMGPALAWLAKENEKRPVTDRILPAALLVKAVALAVKQVPELNGHWVEEALRPSAAVHVGIAISLREGGLVAPALHDTDRKDLPTVMQALADLVARARAGVLRSSEVSDPTLTVTNLGDLGADSVLGVIFPPQVALVGFGRLREKPWAEDGRVVARPSVTATLSADHRASDGHRGGVFLATLQKLLARPETL